MAAECGLVAAWGETDEYANRYHEHASRSKRAAGARTDQIHAHSVPWTLAVGAGSTSERSESSHRDETRSVGRPDHPAEGPDKRWREDERLGVEWGW
jgi:hypothetical protein